VFRLKPDHHLFFHIKIEKSIRLNWENNYEYLNIFMFSVRDLFSAFDERFIFTELQYSPLRSCQ